MIVEIFRKSFLASVVPVIVNAILNEHHIICDIVAFVSKGDFPRSRLGEKQRGKILASWVTRKMRTIAQFSIRDPDNSEVAGQIAEVAEPLGDGSGNSSMYAGAGGAGGVQAGLGSSIKGGSSLKNVESAANLPSQPPGMNPVTGSVMPPALQTNLPPQNANSANPKYDFGPPLPETGYHELPALGPHSTEDGIHEMPTSAYPRSSRSDDTPTEARYPNHLVELSTNNGHEEDGKLVQHSQQPSQLHTNVPNQGALDYSPASMKNVWTDSPTTATDRFTEAQAQRRAQRHPPPQPGALRAVNAAPDDYSSSNFDFEMTVSHHAQQAAEDRSYITGDDAHLQSGPPQPSFGSKPYLDLDFDTGRPNNSTSRVSGDWGLLPSQRQSQQYNDYASQEHHGPLAHQRNPSDGGGSVESVRGIGSGGGGLRVANRSSMEGEDEVEWPQEAIRHMNLGR